MKSLSEQLNDLAAGAKKTQDFVTAARAKNRAILDQAHESLKTSIANGEARIDADTAAAEDTARSWWNDTRQSIHARVAQLRAEREDHHAARDVRKAERRAEEAEQDAADAVDFALAMLDEAEYALADAALARIDADELAVRQLT
jgi:uncharacterized phage infection (PIP) family protein YhgE